MRLFLLTLIVSFSVFEGSLAATSDSLKYINATNFELIGKGFTETSSTYERLPASLEAKTRPAVWWLSKNCSGLAIRFRTNSTIIAAKWEVTGDIVMNHFAPSGIKGLDLYGPKNGKWQFVNSARPSGKITSATIIENMAGTDMEYMLYLPLYDGLANLEIGVESTATIGNPLIDSPRKEKPVVFYREIRSLSGNNPQKEARCPNSNGRNDTFPAHVF